MGAMILFISSLGNNLGFRASHVLSHLIILSGVISTNILHMKSPINLKASAPLSIRYHFRGQGGGPAEDCGVGCGGQRGARSAGNSHSHGKVSLESGAGRGGVESRMSEA